jgi:hypothetical protein
MSSEESRGPDVEQEPSPPERESPERESPEVEALLQRYRSRARAQRKQQRRHVLIGIGALVGAAGLLVAVIVNIGPGTPPPAPAPEPLESAVAVPESDELRPPPPTPPPAPPPAPIARATAPREVASPPRPPAPPPSRKPSKAVTVSYQPRERLARVRAGDTKERVFELFGGTFEQHNGSLVRIEGMRLRASGRSPDHGRVEVAEVEVGETGGGSRYWFLFADGRLVAWGRPSEWPAAAGRYHVDIDYH